MSITAFPVLARILAELNLLHTPVGQYSIAASAIDDAIAWCLLALVVALINNPTKAVNAAYVFLIVIAFAIFLWFIVKPFFRSLIRKSNSDSGASQFNVFIVLTCMAMAAWFTQALGVHAIFGAFMIGLIVPHEKGFAIAMTEKIEDLVSILFLPLYFAYSGLNTQLGELNDGKSWLVVFLVFISACGGKILGCTLAARFAKLQWRESFAIGILMNTKGLVEIIVLNLGLKSGLITPKVFAIFLVMALMTTFMTVPLVTWVYPASKHVQISFADDEDRLSVKRLDTEPNLLMEEKFSILVCLPETSTTTSLMKFVQLLVNTTRQLDLWGMRMIELEDRNSKVMMVTESLHTLRNDPVIGMFRTFCELNKIDFHTTLSVGSSSSYPLDVADACEIINFDICICPISMSTSTYPDGWATEFFNSMSMICPAPLAILLDRGYGATAFAQFSAPISIAHFNTDVFVLLHGTEDDLQILVLLENIVKNASTSVTIHCLHKLETESKPARELLAIAAHTNVAVEYHGQELATKDYNIKGLQSCELVLVGHQTYTKNSALKNLIDNELKASVMIIRAKQTNFAIMAPTMVKESSSAGLRHRTIVSLTP